MVGFDSLPTHSNKEERGINMANMEVRILAMRNIDRLRVMSLEELAPLLISLRVIDGEYDSNHNFSVGKTNGYQSPSGKFYMSYVDALTDCIKWLDEEYHKEN